ncbi:MAG: ferritin-like domain-containing protein [Caldimonas sp.]
MTTAKKIGNDKEPFLTDVKQLRKLAREHLANGAVTPNYKGDKKRTIDLLQGALATEIVCVLRYTAHSIMAEGIASESVAAEFKEHADDERSHAMLIANRIDQLGGDPDFDPATLTSRSATEYAKGDLVAMIKENLVAERIVIEHYRELIRFFGDNDPTTRVMIEGILSDEEGHASDMHDLLVAREGKPFLPQ